MKIHLDKYIDKKNNRKLEVIFLENLWVINCLSESSYVFLYTYIFDNEEDKENKFKEIKKDSNFELIDHIEKEVEDFEISDSIKKTHTIFQVFKKGKYFVSCKTVTHTSEKSIARNNIIGIKNDILYSKSYNNANALNSNYISDLNFPFIRTLYENQLFLSLT